MALLNGWSSSVDGRQGQHVCQRRVNEWVFVGGNPGNRGCQRNSGARKVSKRERAVLFL